MNDVSGIIFDIKRYAIHDGPGIRTTVFFKGCPLRCAWCHNPESYDARPELAIRTARCCRCMRCVEACTAGAIRVDGDGPVTNADKCVACGACAEACSAGAREIMGRKVTVDEVVGEVAKDSVFYDESGGGVTFSGGEPLMQAGFLCALGSACRDAGIHTAVDTTCHARWDVIEQVAEWADMFLCDIKHLDSAEHKRLTGVGNETILDNIGRLAQAGKDLIVRMPVIAAYNDGDESIEAVGRFVASLKTVKRVDLLAYNRGGYEKAQRLVASCEMLGGEAPSAERMESLAERLSRFGLEAKIGG